jgi:hypothetical protein
VSGVSSQFSTEFYARVRERLAPGGVFGQWIHLYEISDALVLSVLAAVHRNFPSYQIFLVHSADMFIVAGTGSALPKPDWNIFRFPGVREDLARTYPFEPELMEASRFLTREGLAPLLDGWPFPNSDFFPVLDLGAERTRFLQVPATGFLSSASGPFDVGDAFLPSTPGDGEVFVTPVPQIPMGRALTLRNRIRNFRNLTGHGRPASPPPEDVPEPLDPGGDLELRQGLFREQVASTLLDLGRPPEDWGAWLREVLEGGGWGADTGWKFLDPGFLDRVETSARRMGAPPGVMASVSFLKALVARNWEALISPSEVLAWEIGEGRRWLNPSVVLDAGVLARISSGDAQGAETYFYRLEPLSGRSNLDLRARLLRAHLDRALSVR